MSEPSLDPKGDAPAAAVQDAAATIEYAASDVPNAPTEGYGTRSARGGIVMTAMTLASSAINFGANILLAWLLLPSTFGLVAVAVSISALIGVLRDAGAPIILVERQHEFRKIAGSVFWVTLGSSTLCAILVSISAPFVAHWKAQPELLSVLLLTAVRFPISAMGMVSQTKLMIDLRWGAVSFVNLLQPVITGGMSALMAWRGFGVYSLVVPPIFAEAVRGIVSWWLASDRAPFQPQWDLMSSIIRSSFWIILNNLTLVARGTGSYLILSFMLGEHETGLYYYAFTMAQALSRLSLGTLPSVLGPVFSKVKHEHARHAEIITRATHTFAAIGVLPIVMQFLMAWPLFRLFLAAKWEPSASLFAITSLMTLACFLNLVFFQAVWASGFYKQFFWYSAIFTPVMLGMFVVGTHMGGATGVAWASVIAAALDFALFPIVAFPLLKLPWKPVMMPLWRPLVAAIPGVLCAVIVYPLLPASKIGDVARILIVGVVGTLSYIGILYVIWRPVVEAMLAHVLRALKVRRA